MVGLSLVLGFGSFLTRSKAAQDFWFGFWVNLTHGGLPESKYSGVTGCFGLFKLRESFKTAWETSRKVGMEFGSINRLKFGGLK